MANANHNIAFRPLRGGVGILNPRVMHPGTLGAILSAGTERYLLSCHHVLVGESPGAVPDGEAVYQPNTANALVATVALALSDRVLDCAVARVVNGVDCLGEILGLPVLAGIADPVEGMRVIKSGAETGVTEGVVDLVNGDQVRIAVPSEFDAEYELSAEGDSGALWVCRDSMKAVALHKGGSASGVHFAFSTRLNAILGKLGMQLLI